jgi:hypothetical protein
MDGLKGFAFEFQNKDFILQSHYIKLGLEGHLNQYWSILFLCTLM